MRVTVKADPWPPNIGATVEMGGEQYRVTSTMGYRAFGRPEGVSRGRECSLIKRLTSPVTSDLDGKEIRLPDEAAPTGQTSTALALSKTGMVPIIASAEAAFAPALSVDVDLVPDATKMVEQEGGGGLTSYGKLLIDEVDAVKRMEVEAKAASSGKLQALVAELSKKEKRRKAHPVKGFAGTLLDEPYRTRLRVARKELATRSAEQQGLLFSPVELHLAGGA